MKGAADVRLFVAVHPPLEAARALVRSVEGLGVPPGRDAPAEQVHLTLLFIGNRSPRELAHVAESVERAAAGVPAFTLRVAALRTLPETGPARLVAATTDGPPELLEIHRRLVTRLSAGRKDASRFTPHLTLRRFPAPIAALAASAPVEDIAFRVEAVSLMHSDLRPAGARHAEVSRAALAREV